MPASTPKYSLWYPTTTNAVKIASHDLMTMQVSVETALSIFDKKSTQAAADAATAITNAQTAADSAASSASDASASASSASDSAASAAASATSAANAQTAAVAAATGIKSATVDQTTSHLMVTFANDTVEDAGLVPGSSDGSVAAFLEDAASNSHAAVLSTVDAHLGGDSTGLVTDVAAITPDNAKRAVGKGEIIVNATDHGADPTGAASSVDAINTLLATGVQHVLVTGGTFLIDGAINLSIANQRLTIDESATLRVASGYSGDVFLIDGGGSSIRGVVIDGGGTIRDTANPNGQNSVPGAWTAVHFRAASAGTTACRVEGLQFNQPGTAFRWENTGTGWVNGCIVKGCRVLYPETLIETVHSGTALSFEGNTVQDIMGQAGVNTSHGVKALSGTGWNFLGVSLWDLPTTSTMLDVASDAADVTIIGGLLATGTMTNAAAAGEVCVIAKQSLRPWQSPTHMYASGFIPEANQGTPPYLTTATSWPVMMFLEADSAADVFWTCPSRVYRVAFEVTCLGVTVNSGVAHFQVYLQSNTTQDAQKKQTVDITPVTNAASSTTTPILAVDPGTRYRVQVKRVASDSADTLTGAIGLIEVVAHLYPHT